MDLCLDLGTEMECQQLFMLLVTFLHDTDATHINGKVLCYKSYQNKDEHNVWPLHLIFVTTTR